MIVTDCWWSITCYHSGLSATSELYPFFFRPGVMTSVQLWFCGWDKKQIHATFIDLTSPCPPLESWISCLRREIIPRVYFLWTWFHENERRRHCPLLLPGPYSCSLTQYTQKLPEMKSCPGYCHLQMRGLPPSFCTWHERMSLLSSLFSSSSSSSQAGNIPSPQSIC